MLTSEPARVTEIVKHQSSIEKRRRQIYIRVSQKYRLLNNCSVMDGANNFRVIDYCMLGLTVGVSVSIGLYHAFRGNKTPEEFAMGGRTMKPLPVSLSLLASFLSATSILGEDQKK